MRQRKAGGRSRAAKVRPADARVRRANASGRRADGPGARARKRFGQHFFEPAWAAKLVGVIDPQADEVFVEIGPGRGALTRPLAERARHVVAFEIDRDLAAAMRADAPDRVKLVEADFLAVTPEAIAAGVRGGESARPGEGGRGLRVAGNLPYNVASPILFKLLELFGAGLPLADATVMLQREVADRLVARPGTKDYGVLSILVQHQADAARLLALPPGAFRPAPKVHSAVVRLRFHAPDPEPMSQGIFVALVQAIFTRRRKTIANALLAFEPSSRLPPAAALAEARIAPTRRPETLSVAELVRLSDAFSRAVL